MIATRSHIMGMAAASALTTKIGFTFRPRIVMMIGVCAGDSGETQFGDLIAGSPVWDYGSGKLFELDEHAEKFEPAIYQITLTAEMRGLVDRVSQRSDALRELRNNFQGEKPRADPKVIIGPLASGAAVVASRSRFKDIQDHQHRKLVGIEMEAYGVMLAAQEVPHPKPQVIVLKAVQDYADQEKNDRYRSYACYVSAGAVPLVLEELASELGN